MIYVPGEGHAIRIGRAVKLVPRIDAPFVAPFQLFKCLGVPYLPISWSPEIQDLILLYWRLGDDADSVGRFAQLKTGFHTEYANTNKLHAWGMERERLAPCDKNPHRAPLGLPHASRRSKLALPVGRSVSGANQRRRLLGPARRSNR